MLPIFLTSIKTRDHVTLDGIVAEPKRKKGTALIWIHGLSSRFSSGQTLTRELSTACQKNGWGYVKFNTRGHDIINRDGAKTKKLHGAGFEKFSDCVQDVRAMVQFAKRRGFKKIILAGHSTGANKALYYIYKTCDRSMKGLVLIAPISDRAIAIKKHGAPAIARGLRIAKALKKRKAPLMPIQFGIISPARYQSLSAPSTAEDVFPYHNLRARWKELRSVHTPIAVIVGNKDQYLDRTARQLIEIFRANAHSTTSFTGSIITGANHGFQKKEQRLTTAIMTFIQRAIV